MSNKYDDDSKKRRDEGKPQSRPGAATYGVGVVYRENDNAIYRGTLPKSLDGSVREEMDVVVVPKEHLTYIIRADLSTLLLSKTEMNDDLSKTMPTTIGFMGDDGEIIRMYLDRSFYTTLPKQMVFMRYVAFNQLFFEEGYDVSDKDELDDLK